MIQKRDEKIFSSLKDVYRMPPGLSNDQESKKYMFEQCDTFNGPTDSKVNDSHIIDSIDQNQEQQSSIRMGSVMKNHMDNNKQIRLTKQNPSNIAEPPHCDQ